MFLTRRNTSGGIIQSVMYVKCQHPGCTNCFENTNNGRTRLPDEALCHIAAKKGWWIHFKKRRAFCPQHVRH